jgi:hypothetical protein
MLVKKPNSSCNITSTPIRMGRPQVDDGARNGVFMLREPTEGMLEALEVGRGVAGDLWRTEEGGDGAMAAADLGVLRAVRAQEHAGHSTRGERLLNRVGE